MATAMVAAWAAGAIALVAIGHPDMAVAGSGMTRAPLLSPPPAALAAPVAVVPASPVAVQPPANGQPPAPPPASQPAASQTGTGVWAVLVGIDDYPGGGRDLGGAVNDARDMRVALERFGVPGDQIVALHDAAASAAAIEAAVDAAANRAGPAATFVFFYSGHIRKLAAGTEALVGADDGLLTDAALAVALGRVQAGRQWIVLAGCYGGGFTEVLRPGVLLTAAADADELAYESQTFDRSYLGEYLVRRALLGEQGASGVAQDAVAWAQAALQQESPGHQLTSIDQSGGPIVLGPPVVATRAPPPAAAAPSDRPPSEPPREQPPDEGDSAPCARRLKLLCSTSL